MTDEQIIERVRQGEVELFAQVHARYYRTLFRFVRRHGCDADTADDLVSEAFLRAYRSLPGFHSRGEGSFLSYLFRIAQNLAIDQSRRAPAGQAMSLEDAPGCWAELADLAADVEERVLRREERSRVLQCLERLAPGDRQIILLAYDEELSGAEIRSVMGKPSISAVTSHLHRAMKKLRALVDAACIGERTQTGEEGRRRGPQTQAERGVAVGRDRRPEAGSPRA